MKKENMIHYDLFSGIGGFAYAIDQVYGKENTKHIFVENDPFCQAVLRKHWSDSEIHGDIRGFVADTERQRPHSEKNKQKLESKRGDKLRIEQSRNTILTGGFPCQPFSQAGVRKGTADDRYLWPEMFRVISEARPKWVIAENVVGLLTIQNGLVFEQVCTDLESQDYEVQAFIIPACAVGAPHRRDRVWIVAHSQRRGERSKQSKGSGAGQSETKIGNGDSNASNTTGGQSWEQTKQEGREDTGGGDTNAQNPIGKRSGRRSKNGRQVLERQSPEVQDQRPNSESWERSWQEVAFATCYDGVDDGLPRQMDGVAISGARHRKERLKSCGNAIVPQVAIKIIEAIKGERNF